MLSEMGDEPACTAFQGEKPVLDDDGVDAENCFKILLATDNHIGYGETDPVRGTDSINTFIEILELAVSNDVDMLLLGGDLFHENKPSRTSMFQTIAALREHTLGERPVTMRVISDDGIGIARDAKWSNINYEDENMSVGLPVFSIHGNHDDPQGTGAEGALCALDVLSASGLVNYFGRLELPGGAVNDAEAVDSGLAVRPVLLQKGTTKLALYGMGNIRDERFHHEMQNGRIRLFEPVEDHEEYFNLLLVHQNRVPRGVKNYVADTAFGDEAHLIVWGHEHDCIEKAGAVPVTGRKYYITQPGSSVATSLAAGEAIPKHVSLVKIQNGQFQMDSIRLRSVRPFVFEDIVLSQVIPEPSNAKGDQNKLVVSRCLKAKVEEMIAKANAEYMELHPEADEEAQKRMIPLIRLRVDCSGDYTPGKKYEVGNPQRFGQDFIGRVANPSDIVQFHSKKSAVRKAKNAIDLPDDKAMKNIAKDDEGKAQISEFVAKYLESQNLVVLQGSKVSRALEKFIDKGETTAINSFVKDQIKSLAKTLTETWHPAADADIDDDITEEILNAQKIRAEREAAVQNKGKQRRNDSSAAEEEGASGEDADPVVDSDDSMMSAATPAKGKGKAAAKPAVKKPLFGAKDSSSSEDSEFEAPSKTKKKVAVKAVAKKAPVKKAPAKKAAAKQIEISSSSDSSDDAPPVKRKAKK